MFAYDKFFVLNIQNRIHWESVGFEVCLNASALWAAS